MVEGITGRELTLEERIGVLRDVVPELLKCSSLFTRTNYDNKIQYFNLLKKQYIAVVLRLVTLGDGIRDVEKRERLTKRCRRCIKIFNNDDFYYFFANIEEETSPLFALFASPSFCVCLLDSSQSYRVITNHNPLQCSLYPVSITHRRGDYREIQRGVSLQAIVWFLHKVTFVRP